MSAKNGAVIGGVIAFLFYVLLSIASPLDEKSIFPTAHVVSDSNEMKDYAQKLPLSMVMFLALEIVGMLLGAIGYHLLSNDPPSPKIEKK